jgi:hypothetical protein
MLPFSKPNQPKRKEVLSQIIIKIYKCWGGQAGLTSFLDISNARGCSLPVTMVITTLDTKVAAEEAISVLVSKSPGAAFKGSGMATCYQSSAD